VTVVKATGPQRRQLYDLAVAVRRTVPRDLTIEQADALIAEFKQLPKLPPLMDAASRRAGLVAEEPSKPKPPRRVRQGRGYRRAGAVGRVTTTSTDRSMNT